MPDIKHAIAIEASPEVIYALIGSGEGFTKWWAADVKVEERGRVADLGFFNRTTTYRLRLEAAAAPLEVEWRCQTGREWQGTSLHFQLSRSKTQTVLRFTHADWQGETEYFVSCNTTWGELMFRLKAAAEGKSCQPLFTEAGLA